MYGVGCMVRITSKKACASSRIQKKIIVSMTQVFQIRVGRLGTFTAHAPRVLERARILAMIGLLMRGLHTHPTAPAPCFEPYLMGDSPTNFCTL